MLKYFARTTAGTENLAWIDIQTNLPTARLIKISRRIIEFLCQETPDHILSLACVDDVTVFVGEVEGLDHTRASLARITEQIAALHFSAAIALCRQIRPLSQPMTYRVTASLLGKRNYSRHEVAEAVRQGLQKQTNWVHQENAPNLPNPTLDIRLVIENERCLVGLRPGMTPLHRRSYKVSNLPGSLHPPVAYCLSRLAVIQPGDRILDPMCGVGTIAAEANILCPDSTIYGSDIEPQAVSYAKLNCSQLNVKNKTMFWIGDAAEICLADHTINRIICNLPWGRQITTSQSLNKTYIHIVQEFERVLATTGRMILLTDQTELLLQAIQTHTSYQLIFATQIHLFGSHPTMLVLAPAKDTPYPLSPFGNELDNLIERTFATNLSHPDPHIRIHTLHLAAWFPKEQTIKQSVLQVNKQDPDRQVRQLAEKVLAKL